MRRVTYSLTDFVANSDGHEGTKTQSNTKKWQLFTLFSLL